MGVGQARGIGCDGGADAKFIGGRAAERHLPPSVSIPIPVLIGLLTVMFLCGDAR